MLRLARMGLLLPTLKKTLRLQNRYPKRPRLGKKLEFPWQEYPGYNCFACCSRNAHGLKIEFFETEDADLACYWTAQGPFENYPGMVHGGLIATALDELMSLALFHRVEHFPVTIQAEFQWLKGIKIGESLTGSAIFKRKWKGFYQLESFLFKENGKIAATSKGLYFTPSLRRFKKLADLDDIPAEYEKYFATR